MFVRHVCVGVTGIQCGIVLIMHKPTKKYFLNNVNDVHSYLRALKHFVSVAGSSQHNAFQAFKDLSEDSTLEDWEFHYSLNPNDPLPRDVLYEWTYVYSKSLNDAVTNKAADLTVFKVEHKNTTFPVYVVDKSSAKKNAIVKKAISQLKKYTLAGDRMWYSGYVCRDPNLFQRAMEFYECSKDNLAGKSMHDVRYEPVQIDKDTFATHAAAAASLNVQALKEWKQSLMQVA